ncbi:cytochrome c maturation protein CcmE [Marinicella rhabdoformis]|uniref:cytochrome c maturation protein CcmE n=1 Tax=Marinicella rhabdoformis TaxID=2580566 RepID=UPI0012AECADD|nr:cytochrome c maturation protein CcmE [Marinicella rhabdoformis]
MTPTRKKRLLLILLVFVGVAIATGIFLLAFKENIMFFKSPTEIAAGDFPQQRSFRIGGMVKDGSLTRAEDSLKSTFVVTDHQHDVTVEYEGILPDLFREGQGVVAIGIMKTGELFVAEEVLAKHDENYMPPEAAAALEAGKKAAAKSEDKEGASY